MYYFIVNTQARTENAVFTWNEVKRVLKQKNIAYKAFETKCRGDATEIARKLTARTKVVKRIIILGGDGTINEVINGIADFNYVQIGVIPSGTGNDFARNLGISGKPNRLIEDILLKEEGVKLDLGKVTWNGGNNSRLFCISSGAGFDAEVCKRTSESCLKRIFNKLHCGKLAYIMVTIRSLFLLRTFDMSMRLEDGTEQTFPQSHIQCCNES